MERQQLNTTKFPKIGYRSISSSPEDPIYNKITTSKQSERLLLIVK